MDLISQLARSPWFLADVILSITGGLIVFWGLTIEKKAEKLLPPEDFKPGLFDDVIKAQKRELERGWRILMFGIGFEVIAALGISVISGLEIADLSNKSATSNLLAHQAEKNAAEANEQVEKLRKKNVEYEMALLTVSNSASLNSPRNLPISSVDGGGWLDFPKQYSWVGEFFKKQSFGLWLMNRDAFLSGSTGGIFLICHADMAIPNRNGDVSLSIYFKFSDLRTSGASQDVTFNNLASAKLDLWTNADPRSDSTIETKYSKLTLRLNSQFDADLVFPQQTNSMGNIVGFVQKQ